MKHKGESDSKTQTPKTSTNKRQSPEVRDTGGKLNASLLKKNEFALIILGALLLTIVMFFLFFRSSDTQTEPAEKKGLSTSFTELDKRIETIEQLLHAQENSDQTAAGKTSEDGSGIDPVEERLTRLETAFSVKFASLIERVGKIEKNISQLKNKPVATITPKTTSEPKPSIPVKKAVKKEKTATMFHTVQKGETLYAISKKYSTTIAAIQKLNNFSAKTTIHPGDKIRIR